MQDRRRKTDTPAAPGKAGAARANPALAGQQRRAGQRHYRARYLGGGKSGR